MGPALSPNAWMFGVLPTFCPLHRSSLPFACIAFMVRVQIFFLLFSSTILAFSPSSLLPASCVSPVSSTRLCLLIHLVSLGPFFPPHLPRSPFLEDNLVLPVFFVASMRVLGRCLRNVYTDSFLFPIQKVGPFSCQVFTLGPCHPIHRYW